MSPDHLAQVLTHRAGWPTVPQDWALLLSQARRANLVARLAEEVRQLGVAVPTQIGWQLDSATKAQRHLARAMTLELRRVVRAVREAGVDCVLLKGAAYLAAGLPPATARMFGDIDILVALPDLACAEDALMGAGWIALSVPAYSQRYYREWMHEIPPLTHISRGSVVDLHHTIVPPTSVFRVDGAALLRGAQQTPGAPGLQVLQPVDMVLHSLVHLFTEGEFDNGLRDVLDLWDLLRHFGQQDPSFWDALFVRAGVLGLTRPLYHGLHHLERLTGPLVPSALRPAVRCQRPGVLMALAMHWLLSVALRPMHPACARPGDGLARWLLYVRSHWLRMPLRLLLPHLVRKAWMARFAPAKPGAGGGAAQV